MKQIFYEVHSDLNPSYALKCFEGKGSKQASIAFAKANKDKLTYVDRVVYYTPEEEYEYECVYDWEVEE